MNKISTYPKVYALGHRSVKNIFEGCYSIEEKIDGSQFSFGLINGELFARSKGVQLDIENPEKMFSKAVKYVKSIKNKLCPNFIYRTEYLQKPKHNTLCYEIVPKNNLILFDVEDIYGNPFRKRDLLKQEAKNLEIEVIPQIGFYCGTKLNLEFIDKLLLDTESCLGKEKIEGIIIKNRDQETPDKKYMVAKYVSERFKERHDSNWKDRNPNRKDIIDILINNLKTEARYYKSVQHLRDSNNLEHSPKDIGLLMKELQNDIDLEEQDYIKDVLYKKFIKDIKRGVCRGLPEWYKQYLIKESY